MRFDEEKSKIEKVLTLAVIVLIALIAAIGGMYRIPLRLENYGEDYLYRKLEGIPEDIKIIAIDDESLNALGPYSDWDRSYFARLIEILNADEEKRPKVIGIDVIFSGTNDSPEDRALVEAAARSDNLVFASSVESDYRLLTEEGKYYTSTYISNEYKPFDELAAVAEYGFTNVINDSDGIVRRTYTRIPPDHVSFAYRIASRLSELPEYRTREEVMYSVKPGEVEAISMARVLDGTVPPEHFAGAVVLVGAYTGGMLDSYKVPCDYQREMYGVEMQANYIIALMHGRTVRELPSAAAFLIVLLVAASFGVLIVKSPIRRGPVWLLVFTASYLLIAFSVFWLLRLKLPLVAPVGAFAVMYILSLFYNYVLLLKKRQRETQEMLFSMAEGFAEAIEGRTPYNANHTKNVARRCVEMLDYINELHKAHKSELFFTNADKKQLYLAAMLHDVGKMDVPLEVMDKPTKLGSKEAGLRDRLTIITLKLKNDILSGRGDAKRAEQEIEKIRAFEDRIDAFNCGRPLSDDEWAIIAGMEEGVYTEEDGSRTSYLTEEEKADLHIERGTLSDGERTVMQSHVVYTDKILSHMTFGDAYKDVRAMAANHHELLNGRGYPKKLTEKDLDVKTRILTIMDIYDSLIADDRPYKKPKPVDIAFKIMEEEAEAGKIDKDLLAIAKDLYLNRAKDGASGQKV